MTPEDIIFREVESESVVIQWTVAYISYSPETYVVQYGTSRETLVHNSSRRASEVGTTTYSISLSGLRNNTTYYVQVLATNTALRSSRSRVESFTTLSTMEMASGVSKWLWSPQMYALASLTPFMFPRTEKRKFWRFKCALIICNEWSSSVAIVTQPVNFLPMSRAIFQSTTLLHYSSVGQPGSSLAAPVAGVITALIAVLVAVIIIVFILLRYCMRSRQ